jgi:hypothetical protein
MLLTLFAAAQYAPPSNNRIITHLKEDEQERRRTSEDRTMIKVRRFGTSLGAALLALYASSGMLAAADPPYKTVNGLSVYLAVVPAEMLKGVPSHSAEQPMLGTGPQGTHEFLVVAAIFDATTRARVSDARVTAQVSGLGLSDTERPLEPMEIAGTTPYGGFFDFPAADLYAVRLTVERPLAERPVVLDFKYDHRR